jgi:hypothetical protein
MAITEVTRKTIEKCTLSLFQRDFAFLSRGSDVQCRGQTPGGCVSACVFANIRGKLMLSQNVTNLSALFSSSKNQVIKSCHLRMSDHIGGATLELLALIASLRITSLAITMSSGTSKGGNHSLM